MIKRIYCVFRALSYKFKENKIVPLPEKWQMILSNIRTNKAIFKKIVYNEQNRFTLSIVITSYNSSKWLSNTITSIKAQTELPDNIELIFVDNHSTDDSLQIIKDEVKKLSVSTKIFETDENKFAGYSCSKGMELSLGQFVLFLDGDDALEPNCVRNILDAIKENPDSDMIQLTDNKNQYKKSVIINSDSFYSINAMPGGKVINRNTWANLGFPLYCNFEDMVIDFYFYPRAKKIVTLDTKDYWIRPNNSDSLSRKFSPSLLDHFYVTTLMYSSLNNKNELAYKLLIWHFGWIAYSRCSSFSLEIQLSAFCYMKAFLEENKLDVVLPPELKRIEKAILIGNFNRWIKACYLQKAKQ